MKRNLAIGSILLLAAGPALGQEQERPDESSLLIAMSYDGGVWQARATKVLPCPGPSKPDNLSPARSMFQLKNREGKVLYRRYILNPRIILVEDPREPAPLLKQTRFTLAVPIKHEGKRGVQYRDVSAFEFFEKVGTDRQQEKPSVSVRLDKDMEELTRTAEAGKRVPCQVAAPSTEHLPKLTLDPGTAVSLDSLASLLQHDRGALIHWGLERNLTPDALRKIVKENEKHLGQVSLTPERAEELLREYDVAYKKRK